MSYASAYEQLIARNYDASYAVARDPSGDAASYLEIARSFARLGAGENALLATARLERARGHRVAAVHAFERYLALHPAGRFVREANAHLRELRATTDLDP
jgi:hypothetical protein